MTKLTILHKNFAVFHLSDWDHKISYQNWNLLILHRVTQPAWTHKHLESCMLQRTIISQIFIELHMSNISKTSFTVILPSHEVFTSKVLWPHTILHTPAIVLLTSLLSPKYILYIISSCPESACSIVDCCLSWLEQQGLIIKKCH